MRTAPYGSWKSPLPATAGAGIEELSLSEGVLYWTESRPEEGGRSVLLSRAPDGRVRELSPPPFDVRSRTHGYGGGAFAALGETVVFSNLEDGRLYRLDGGVPRPITPPAGARYADLRLDAERERVICVREDHSGDGPRDEIVAVPLDGRHPPEVLFSGPDFLASPRLSPDGSRLAWLSWDLPNMPWDGTWLWTAELDAAGRPAGARRVAGGPSESVLQPEWSPRGLLYFVSDRAGWWNLYRLSPYGRAEPVCPMKAEFGVPQWAFGLSTYAFAGENAILCAYTRRGVWRLAVVNVADRRISPLESPFTHVSQVRAENGEGAFVGATFDGPPRVVRLELPGSGPEEVYRPAGPEVEPGYLSVPEVVEVPSGDGARVHAFLYRPANAAFTGPPGERPPLLVQAHGGPTGAARPHFSPEVQYWTSRGFAVLDVNYAGSTGFGRAYRERLRGRWGVAEVEDCAAAARHAAAAGEADEERLIIRGWSAGGYTALAALASRGEFAAGASYFGPSDLEAFVRKTHRFESRYLEGLVGPYPERADLYRERSPLHRAGEIRSPLILFQGLEDEVVPPEQSRLLYERLRDGGVPVALLEFEGEGHGFRRERSLRRALEAELHFYSRVLRIPLPDPVEPVEITNLPREGDAP
ncbi:peptidase [Rubrobacter xylanophilus]|uniref:Peptidase n=2 Tax=Rubrobacter xylanophilus TaxID=49319 RepID=A0A510HQ26_9ACTN|nr:peptidase [Rubrobacter xylanophilus]